MSADFAQLQRFLREASGMALDDDKRYLVEDRLRDLLRDHAIANLGELMQRLRGRPHSDLARAVAETLTINETSFFRDRGFFGALSDTLLPQLLEARRDARRLRIWCAGCSTGQEPYSIAMLLDAMSHRLAGWHVTILATDLSRSIIALGASGTYSQFEVQRGLPVAMLLRHFHRTDAGWRINDALRAKVTFRTQNLLAVQRDIGCFDLVLCRNVLFYFDAETKRHVLDAVTEHLAPDGFLALGGAERIGASSDLLQDAGTPFVFRHRRNAELPRRAWA